MDFIEEIFDKIREIVEKVLDALLGPDTQVEPELIPVPVDEKRR